MARVFSVARSTMPMPPRIYGDDGARSPGGDPPVAYRSSTAKWVGGSNGSREPSNCGQIASEIHQSSVYHNARSLKRELSK